MKISIAAVTSISFDVETDNASGVLELRGGEWCFSDQTSGIYWNLGQGRIHWTVALRRLVEKLEGAI
jgi:hypothetical protein